MEPTFDPTADWDSDKYDPLADWEAALLAEETADSGGREPKRCERCSNWESICGHNLPFAERIRSVNVDKTSLKVGGNVKDD